MTPAPRAVIVLAVIALAALVVPLGLAALAALALIVAVLVDARAARAQPQLERQTPEVLSRGIPAHLTIRAQAPAGGTVRVRQATPPALAVEPQEGESGIEVSLPTPGQNALLTFPGSAGQQVTASFDGQIFQSCAYLSVLKPDGSTLVSRLGCGAALALPPQTLPGTGIYTVKLDPAGGGTGSATVSITSP